MISSYFARRIFPAVFISLLCFASAAFGEGEEGVHFAYKFQKGHFQKFKGEFNQEYSYKGFSYVILVEMEIYEECIGAEGDTLFRMQATFDDISSAMRMNDNLMENTLDNQLIGKTVAYDLDRLGHVRNIKSRGYIENWGQTSELLNQIFASWYPLLPGSTIAPGGSWPVHEIEEAEGVDRKEEQNALFDFKEIKKEKGKKCAKVVGDSEHYVHGKISNRFGQFDMEGRGKTQVEFFFDTGGSGIIKLKGQGEMRVDMSDASTSGEKAETHESHITFGFKKELK